MVSVVDHISDNHRRAARMLGYALHSESEDIWLKAKHVWRARLTDLERTALAYSVLSSLDADQQNFVVETMSRSSGMPLPPLSDATRDACDWAAFADSEQLRVTAMACFNGMSRADQAAFVDHITRRAA
ncbi:MAG: hypothetical protein QNJ35_17995 [Paracoccaceae bacterium]|nr:hypothetical protein [Paracoccaceae bacterium]